MTKTQAVVVNADGTVSVVTTETYAADEVKRLCAACEARLQESQTVMATLQDQAAKLRAAASALPASGGVV